MNGRTTVLLALILALATACSSKEPTPEGATEGDTATASETTAKAAGGDEKTSPKGEPAVEKAAAGEAAQAVRADEPSALTDPAKATANAPEAFVVELTTSKGPIRLDVQRKWAPKGVDRFYNLVKAGYFTDVAFFRVIPGFMAQVGLHGDPAINRTWRSANIDDDPVAQSNTRGMVSFATAGPNTRTTQFFINFADNTRLDGMGFAPFARVQAESMAIVDKLHGGYGEGAPRGRGPSQARIHAEGNAYLKAEFPDLDYIQQASVVEE